MDAQKQLRSRRALGDIDARLQFLSVRSVRAVDVAIRRARHHDVRTCTFQETLHLLRHLESHILFTHAIRADRARIAAAMPGIEHDRMPGDAFDAIGCDEFRHRSSNGRHHVDDEAIRLLRAAIGRQRVDGVILLLHLRGEGNHDLHAAPSLLAQRHEASECAVERRIRAHGAEFRILHGHDQMLGLRRIFLNRIGNIRTTHADLDAQHAASILLEHLILEVIELKRPRGESLGGKEHERHQKKAEGQKKSFEQKNHSYRQSHKSVKLRISISLLILP